MKIVAIIQARLGSSRFPSKVLANLNDIPVIDFLITRLRSSNLIDQIAVAIPKGTQDDYLFSHLNKKNISVFRGNELDVLNRFYKAAEFIRLM